jgi:hypothetical protein
MAQKPDLAKREVWRRRLQDFERGEATVVDFCRRLRVPVWSFYYWRQRLWSAAMPAPSDRQRNGRATTRHARSVHRTRRARTAPHLNFVPIQLTGGCHVEVHLPNGTRVTVPCQECDAIDAVIAAVMRSDSPEQPTC